MGMVVVMRSLCVSRGLPPSPKYPLSCSQLISLSQTGRQTLSVEFVHVAKGKEYLQMFMEKKGYVVDSEVTHSNNLANDFIFVKSTLRRALDP
uniref:Uncharacterized protein n=1 Tax=Timema poppense TaxID=170557 RepID=A0A7R9DK93_TIMPO|nr:unnamed protein product [Timema poppensis]